MFVYEKDYQKSSALCSSKSGIHIFSRSLSSFNEAKIGASVQYLFNFVLADAVFRFQFFDYLSNPPDTRYFQGGYSEQVSLAWRARLFRVWRACSCA